VKIRELLKAYEQNEDFLETPGIYQEAELPVLDDETKEESGFGRFAPELRAQRVPGTRRSSGRECVKIADFGVAKWLTPEPGSVSLTVPGTIVGGLHYMSPEQLAGQQVDRRSDIFSIGVMVFEALTGKIPFCGTELCRAHSFHPSGIRVI
jgi:serine/threonine protein kinase